MVTQETRRLRYHYQSYQGGDVVGLLIEYRSFMARWTPRESQTVSPSGYVHHICSFILSVSGLREQHWQRFVNVVEWFSDRRDKRSIRGLYLSSPNVQYAHAVAGNILTLRASSVHCDCRGFRLSGAE